MQYAWLIWSLILLALWVVVYASLRTSESKREMLEISLWTSLLGLAEPIFVPRYWSPPSLFDLAQRTGFDIESLLFSFGVGGIASIVYEWFFAVTHVQVSPSERLHARHRWHPLALAVGPVVFLVLFLATPLNPIYSTFIAFVAGGLGTWYCRPELMGRTLFSSALFTAIYFLFFLSLVLVFPGYVRAVWNLPALSGVLVLGVPFEELMFAAGLGFYWSGLYEHLKWRRTRRK